MKLAISLLLLFAAAAAPAQQVVDRIVARIEGDILTLSEVRELRAFQQLFEGRAGSEQRALEQLIDQWIVTQDAEMAHFPEPSEAEVATELSRIASRFDSPAGWRARLRELGLSDSALRRLLARQLRLARYLDYKFRASAQVDPAAIELYYRETLAPQLAAGGERVAPLEEVTPRIRELLTEREITAQAARWLDDTRKSLRIEFLDGGRR